MALSAEAKQKVLDYQKCKKDLFYFSDNYVRIAQSGTIVTPTLYEPQKEFLRQLLVWHYLVLLKTRQTGGSTASQIYCAWAMVFYKNITVGVVSRKASESTDFAKKVKYIIDSLPPWMAPKYDKETEQSFRLDNGSELFAESVSAANPQSLFRGKSITIAVIDEAAHTNYIDDGYTSFAPALFKAHKVAKQQGVPFALMVISTPNRTVGIGKWFAEMWADSRKQDSLFKGLTLYWKDIPDFADDPEWYPTQCKLLKNDQGRIKQELEMEFLGSTDSWLPLDIISTLNSGHSPPLSIIPFQGGELWQWEMLDIQKFYMIGVDTASAGGSDMSTIEIFDFEDFNQVGEFSGKLEVFDFCKVMHTVNRLYPKSIWVVENNSYGNQVVETLSRSEDRFNLYMYKDDRIRKNNFSGTKRVPWGIPTTSKTRPLMMDALYTYICEEPSRIRSERLALELIGLVEKVTVTTSRVEADEGSHDDLVLAMAFISYCRMYDPPMGVASASTKGAVDDIFNTLQQNEDSITFQPSQVLTPNKMTQFTGAESTAALNQQLDRHVRDKLFDVNQGGHINVLDIIGFNKQ